MAVAVVDRLEAVDVDEQDADRFACPRRTRGLMREGLLERTAVAQPGERVLARELVCALTLALELLSQRAGPGRPEQREDRESPPQQDLGGDGDRPFAALGAIEQRSGGQR